MALSDNDRWGFGLCNVQSVVLGSEPLHLSALQPQMPNFASKAKQFASIAVRLLIFLTQRSDLPSGFVTLPL